MKRSVVFSVVILVLVAVAAIACAPGATPTQAPAAVATQPAVQPTVAAPTIAPTIAPTEAPTTAPVAMATTPAPAATTPAASATAGTAVAVATTPPAPTVTPMSGQITLGLTLSTLNNPFFVTLRDGAQKAATAANVQLIVVDAQDDPAKQASSIEDLINRKVSALILNPTDSNAIVPSVQRANSGNIPVFTVDRAAAGGDVISHIASDNVAGGQMAAEYLCKALNSTGNVVELQGIAGTSAARDRGKGFDDYMAANCPGVKIVAKQPADFDRSKGLSVFENILQSQPTINGVFAQNDEMVLGAIQGAAAANRTGIIFVGFDAVPDALTAIKSGQLAATIAQQPAEMGRLAVENAVNYLKGQVVQRNIAVPLSLVTKDTLSAQATPGAGGAAGAGTPGAAATPGAAGTSAPAAGGTTAPSAGMTPSATP